MTTGYGEYLEDPDNPELHQIELVPPVEDADNVVDPDHLGLHIPLETMEGLFLRALLDSGKDGLKSFLPCAVIKGTYIPLTPRAFDKLDENAQDEVTWVPLQLVANRLAWEGDEAVLPEKLCRKLMQMVEPGQRLPKAVTISFADAATVILERMEPAPFLPDGAFDLDPDDPRDAKTLELLAKIEECCGGNHLH
jgi:hypothetical protein